MPTITINYYKASLASPTGHVGITIDNGDGTSSTYGLGDVSYGAFTTHSGAMARIRDEADRLARATKAGNAISSEPFSITDAQAAALRADIAFDLGKWKYYRLEDADTDPSNGSNCASWVQEKVNNVLGGVRIGDLFSPERRAEMSALVNIPLSVFTSPENRDDFGGTVTPGGGFDSGFDGAGAGFDPDAWKKYFDKAQDVDANTPIVLDLDGGGIQTTAVNPYGAHFDLDANGFAEAVGWVAPGEGLLVRDLDNDGVIDDGRELFGGHVRLPSGQVEAKGFAGRPVGRACASGHCVYAPPIRLAPLPEAARCASV